MEWLHVASDIGGTFTDTVTIDQSGRVWALQGTDGA